MRRIAILCEVLRPPLDEGIRITAAEIASALSPRCDLLLLGEEKATVRDLPVEGALTDRYFTGSALGKALSRFRPDALLYVPWTSLTLRSFLRVAILRRRVPGIPIGVLALQPRGEGWLYRRAAAIGRPDCVLAMGPDVERQAGVLGLRCRRLEGGVDLDRFKPHAGQGREDLRRALGLPLSSFLVLHVGHMKAGRGVLALRGVQALKNLQALLIVSTSTRLEENGQIRRELQEAGVRVVDHHVERIEDYYQAADCYLFPGTSSTDSIELPLSVLEAMACNLPLVTTPFGGLPALLEGAGPGVTVVASEAEIPRAVMDLARENPRPRLRDRVRHLTWEAMAGEVLEALSGAAPEAGSREGGP